MSRRCAQCHATIPQARLEAVPDTRWCVRCAEPRVRRVGGVTRVVDGATEIEVVPSQAEARFVNLVEARSALVSLERVTVEERAL